MGAFKRHGNMCSFSASSFSLLCLLCLGVVLSLRLILQDGTVTSLYREPSCCKSQFILPTTFVRDHSEDPSISSGTGSAPRLGYKSKPRKYTKPSSPQIVGLVFYGRKATVEILNCYLQRNLVENGGFLDEIVFAVKTDNKEDLAYLDELLAANPAYSKHVPEGNYKSWVGSWQVVKPKNIYIKIDDDIVFIEDVTIPAIVSRMVENPEYFSVSANIVNNPALSWMHYTAGVFEPYWPEPKAPSKSPNKKSWRASELPSWSGPKNFQFNGSLPATYPKHRWLPLPSTHDIDDTPASAISQWSHVSSLHDWAVAAQAHYSFLSRLEKSELWRYRFDLLDYHYQRISINLIGVWGKDIAAAFPFATEDDEEYLSVTRPKELKRHVVVEGAGVAVHFAYGPQRAAHGANGLLNTDLLQRYKAYAEEMVCQSPSSRERKSTEGSQSSRNTPTIRGRRG